jgi:hypothetical protein
MQPTLPQRMPNRSLEALESDPTKVVFPLRPAQLSPTRQFYLELAVRFFSNRRNSVVPIYFIYIFSHFYALKRV